MNRKSWESNWDLCLGLRLKKSISRQPNRLPDTTKKGQEQNDHKCCSEGQERLKLYRRRYRLAGKTVKNTASVNAEVGKNISSQDVNSKL